MSKYFIPGEIEGKWELQQHVPLPDAGAYYYEDLSSFDADGYHEHCNLYNNPPKYPTLSSDSAYWASKAGVKMGEGEFNLELVKSKVVDYLEYTAIPIQSPTTKELIEQEAGKPIISEAYNDDGTHSHWRLIDPATGDLLWTQNPEEDTHLWTGKVPFTTFALSLPKQDNGDAWDEAWHNFKRDTPHNFRNFKKLLDYFQQHYSISKK